MATWDARRFDDEAHTIVETLTAAAPAGGGATAEELVEKVAREHALNVEQIRRLGRAVNLRTFEAKHAALSGQPDRYVDFDLVDEDSLIAKLHASDLAAAEKRAAYGALADEFDALRRPRLAADDGTVKMAEDLASLRRLAGDAVPLIHQFYDLRRAVDVYTAKVAGARDTYHAAVAAVVDAARYPDFDVDVFEKQALAFDAFDAALAFVNDVRAARHEPPLVIPTAKVAALRDRLVGEPVTGVTAQGVDAAGRALDAIGEHAKAAAALADCRTRLAAVETALQGR